MQFLSVTNEGSAFEIRERKGRGWHRLANVCVSVKVFPVNVVQDVSLLTTDWRRAYGFSISKPLTSLII